MKLISYPKEQECELDDVTLVKDYECYGNDVYFNKSLKAFSEIVR